LTARSPGCHSPLSFPPPQLFNFFHPGCMSCLAVFFIPCPFSHRQISLSGRSPNSPFSWPPIFSFFLLTSQPQAPLFHPRQSPPTGRRFSSASLCALPREPDYPTLTTFFHSKRSIAPYNLFPSYERLTSPLFFPAAFSASHFILTLTVPLSPLLSGPLRLIDLMCCFKSTGQRRNFLGPQASPFFGLALLRVFRKIII